VTPVATVDHTASTRPVVDDDLLHIASETGTSLAGLPTAVSNTWVVTGDFNGRDASLVEREGWVVTSAIGIRS